MSTWADTPRSRSRALFFAVIAALLSVFVFSVPAFAATLTVNDDPGCNDAGPTYCHIQPAINAAAPGDTINIYPGSYSETAAGSTIFNGATYQFGIFISKDRDNLLLQGVDATGTPITDAAATLAYVTTNATNGFGPSGVFVEGNGVTMAGLKFGPNASGENKTIEIIGDNFTLKNSRIAVLNGSVYFNDWRFDTGANSSYVKSYIVEGNLFELAATLDIASGAGYSGPVSSRQIKNNKFVMTSSQPRTAISFSSTVPTIGWYVYPVSGAVITGNQFSGGEQYIRVRGNYDNTQFDWQSYWNDNSFDRAVVTLVGSSQPGFDVRPYSYTNGGSLIENARRIGALVQPEIDNAAAGDSILIAKGLYTENLTVSKHLKLMGAGSGSDPATNTVLRRAADGSALALSGSGASNSDPILLKNLRIEPVSQYGITLGNAQYVRMENVQVVGSPGTNVESEVCLKVATTTNVSDLTVIDSGFSQCDHGWYFAKDGDWGPGGSNVKNVYVANTSFVDNGFKGIYAEKLSDATFVNCVVTNNGGQPNWNNIWNGGIDINLKGQEAYQNLTFQNLVMSGNGLGFMHGAALMIKARDDGDTYGAHPASLTNVTIEGGIFTGNERGIRVGEPGKNNNSPTNVAIHNASIYGNGKTYTGSDGSAYGGLINYSQAAVNAEYNWWGAASGPSGDGGGSGEAVRNAASGSIDFDPWLGQSPVAALIVPADPIDLPTGATSFTLPVNLMPAAGSLSSAAFSLDYDTACLSINPADANGDGIPDAISGLPGGFVNSIMLDTNDVDGELDVAIWDVTPPLAALPAGAILKIKFDILAACQGPNDHSTFVKFSAAPAATFSAANGSASYRATQSADPLLLDYNAAPTAILLSANTVAENAPAGTTVGALSVTDPDGNPPVYTLVAGCSGGDANNAGFIIDGATLKSAAVFDYEAGSSKSICVMADDGQGGLFTSALAIAVMDVNEPPTAITLSNHVVAEGAAVGTVVGSFTTSGDPETTQTHSYALVPGDGAADNGKFGIAGDQLKTAAMFDYSVQSIFYIRVRSSDSGAPPAFVEKQFVVNVLDHSKLSISIDLVARHNETFGVPVVFTANGNTPTAAGFGVTYNAACLTYVSTSGGTGSAAGGVVTVNTNGPFSNNPLVTINFKANPGCPSGTSVPLAFSAASLNNGTLPLPLETVDGKVLVISDSARGDCNSDGFVNAGDFSAIVLETFDTDAPWWLEAPKSTFPGSPIGCDANASKYIDVADVVCTVLVVFGNSSCTTGSFTAAAAAAAEPSVLGIAPVLDGRSIDVPVTLTSKGATVAGAAFTLTYDPARAALDATDADGDGIPDAVRFATGSAFNRSVNVDAAAGRIQIAVYGLSLPLPAIADGVVATVRLQAIGDEPLAGVSLADTALGNDSGSNTPVEVEVNGEGVSAGRSLYLPAIAH